MKTARELNSIGLGRKPRSNFPNAKEFQEKKKQNKEKFETMAKTAEKRRATIKATTKICF